MTVRGLTGLDVRLIFLHPGAAPPDGASDDFRPRLALRINLVGLAGATRGTGVEVNIAIKKVNHPQGAFG